MLFDDTPLRLSRNALMQAEEASPS